MPAETSTTDFVDGPAFALAIGISTYQHGQELIPGAPLDPGNFFNLSIAHNDAADFARLLVDRLGMSPQNIRTLVNEAASRGEIIDSLDHLRKDCSRSLERGSRDPLVFVYFSGHGWQDGENQTYLVPHDARRDKLAGTAISLKDFTRYLDEVATRKLVVFLDACHSGHIGVSGAKGAAQGVGAGNLIEAVGEGRGRYIIASCMHDQRSWEWRDGRNSIFTKHLLELLGGDAHDFDNAANEFIDLEALYKALKTRVADSAKQQYGVEQQPEIRETKSATGLIVAVSSRVRARKQKEAEIATAAARREARMLFFKGVDEELRRRPIERIHTMSTQLRSYVERDHRIKGYEDFYGVFDDGWYDTAAGPVMAVNEICDMLIYAFRNSEERRRQQQTSRPQNEGALDKFGGSAAVRFASPEVGSAGTSTGPVAQITAQSVVNIRAGLQVEGEAHEWARSAS
jgi:hypothetical protein